MELKSVLIRLFFKPNRLAMAEFLNKRSGCTHREDFRIRVSENGNTLVMLNQESEKAKTLMHREGHYASSLPMAYDSILHAFMKKFHFAAIKHDRHNGSWWCILKGNDFNEPSLYENLRKRKRR